MSAATGGDPARRPVPPPAAPARGAPRLPGAAAAAWRRLRVRLHYLRSFLRPDVVILRGTTETGRPLSILRAGIADRQTAYFFAGQVLKSLTAETALGRAWLWSLPALARRQGCGFVLFRASERRAGIARRLLGRDEAAAPLLPTFLGATVDVTDQARLLRSRDVKNDIRRIRNSGFRCSVTRRRDDLETFVRDYREPYVRSVHGFGAVGIDFDCLLASCVDERMPEPWVLLKLELDGEWVAGDLLVSGPGRAALMEVGVRNGEASLVRRGALQAAYWMSLEYLRGEGHQWVSLMHMPPFLRSGVAQYKLKFGPHLRVANPDDGFLLLFDDRDEAAVETLLRQPMIALRRGRLRALRFEAAGAGTEQPLPVPLERLTEAGVEGVDRVVLGG